MTIFQLNPAGLDKWIYQNKGEYTGDFFEGVLQDNFVIATNRGIAAVYEYYLNCWSSDLLIKFGSYKSGEADKVWSEFIDIEKEAEGERKND